MTAADVVLLALGEDSEDSGEASCLQKIDLPDLQRELAKIACDSGKTCGSGAGERPALGHHRAYEKANAVLEAWSRMRGGKCHCRHHQRRRQSVRKTLCFLPKALGQVPVYYNHLIPAARSLRKASLS